MLHTTPLTAFLALGLLVIGVVATSSPAPRNDVPVSFPLRRRFVGPPEFVFEIPWEAAATDSNMHCGFLEVPMDHHDTSAGTARLAVIKYSTTAPKKLGTIFYNPGMFHRSL